VLDLSEKVSDPLGLLLEVSVGGGTDIARALQVTDRAQKEGQTRRRHGGVPCTRNRRDEPEIRRIDRLTKRLATAYVRRVYLDADQNRKATRWLYTRGALRPRPGPNRLGTPDCRVNLSSADRTA
jgi:hypothetical protein